MKKEETNIKSPLRYPGGKSKALKRILPLIPEFSELREPMVGGGSVFFALKQMYPDKKFWINDINEELFLFWKFCKENPRKLVSEVRKFRKKYVKGDRPKSSEGKELYYYLKSNKENLTDLQRAARFFILNRITFSGLIETGGYSKQAFDKRFTESSIQRIYKASEMLQGVKITNSDYKRVVNKNGKKVFIFLDPPYFSKKGAKLYGENGKIHHDFDDKRLVDLMKQSKHKWLITYDNCTRIQELYKFARAVGWKGDIEEWKLQYGTNNLQEKKARIGSELLIYNYKMK